MEDQVSLASWATEMRFCDVLSSLHSLENFVMSSGFFSWLIQLVFMTFIALQNTLTLPHSCKNQPWSPFVTQIYQPACTLWTTCKVSLVGPACITVEKVNWKRYARAEDCHMKMAIPWQIQGTSSSVPCLQQWPSATKCLDETIRTMQAESDTLYQSVFPAICDLAWGKS